jgi:hypothetical protein
MITILRSVGCASCFGLISLCAGPAVGYGPYDLFVRSNIVDGYQLPANSSFNSADPAIDAAGRVGIQLLAIAGDGTARGIWLGEADGSGGVAWQFNDTDGLVSGVSLDGIGGAWFAVNGASSVNNGVWHSPGTGADLVTQLPIGTSYWAAIEVNDSGEVGYQANFAAGRAWVSFASGATAIHATDSAALGSSPYSYIFTPSFNNARQIAGKVSVTTFDQQEIRVFESNGSSSLVAQNDELDVSSPYASFNNSVALTNDGRVAFIAQLAAGGTGLYLSDGVTTVEIATTADPEISSFEYFAPSVNDAGQVAFRAVDGAGLQTIFVGDGISLERVVTEHDLLPTDLGTGRVDQNNATDSVFGGAPALAPSGDVAFVAALTPPDNDQIEWGSGVFVARAGLFRDGFESGDPSHWSTAVGGP